MSFKSNNETSSNMSNLHSICADDYAKDVDDAVSAVASNKITGVVYARRGAVVCSVTPDDIRRRLLAATSRDLATEMLASLRAGDLSFMVGELA